jgi:zinc protease
MVFSLAAPLPLSASVGAAHAASLGPIRLIEQPSMDQPLVAIRVLFQAGSADDPAGQEGLTHLMAAIVAEGATTKRTWSEVLDALYPMAATIEAYGDKDVFVFSGIIHRDNLEKFADLLADQILLPRFTAEDFNRHKRNALDALTKTLRGNDDENLGKQALTALMYPGHPYAHPSIGTVQGLKACTLDDVRRAYSKTMTQDRLVIGLAGGYSEAFRSRFIARFSVLPAEGKSRAPLPPISITDGMQIQWVEKKALGTAISLGHPISITRADDDFYPLFLAASYLGEHRTFNGLLMLSMRQTRGLNYGDYAYVENFIQDGPSTFPLPNIARRQQHFEIWIRPVAPANAGFAIRQAIFETDRLIRDGIPPAGFEATRRFLGNYLRLWTQDLSRRLGYAMDALIYGKDIQAELAQRLPKMTKDDVDRVIRKYLSTKTLSIVAVGQSPPNLGDSLAQGLPTPITYDSQATPPDVLREDRIIQTYPLPLLEVPSKILSAKDLFEK